MWSACRIGNLVMMKQWLWMKPSVRLLSMGCLQQVVGDWVYIDRLTMLLTDSQNIKVLFSSLSLSLSLSLSGLCLFAFVSFIQVCVHSLFSMGSQHMLFGNRRLFSSQPWNLKMSHLAKGTLPSHDTSSDNGYPFHNYKQKLWSCFRICVSCLW